MEEVATVKVSYEVAGESKTREADGRLFAVVVDGRPRRRK